MVVMFATLLMMCGTAFALPGVEWVKINDNKYEDGDKLVVERGDTLDVEVKMNASDNETDVEAELDLLGYEYNDVDEISDSTHTFDIDQGDTVYKELSVRIPSNVDKDEYDLRLRVGGRTGPSTEYRYLIKVDAPRHFVDVEDVILSPSREVKSGRALLGTVRLENNGDRDEDSVKVTMSIPALGISASDYIDEIEEDEEVTSEELYLRIPSCTESGVYTVEVEVEYDEGYETVTEETSIRIVEDESCYTQPEDGDQPEKTIISVGSSSMELTKGKGGVVYPVTITNGGSARKSYTLSVDGLQGWATSKITPANTVVLEKGETKAMYVYVTATDEATAGERMFSAAIRSDGKVLKEVPLKATVAEGADGNGQEQADGLNWANVKQGLQVGLIVLVVLLVLLGLIVGFNKLKGRDDEDQTYY